MWLLLTLNNIYLSARHTSGTANVLADALSRFHLGDAHVAYVNHVVAALDLNQVFPNEILFSFTVFWLIFTCILITALFSFSLASSYSLTSFRITLFSRRFPQRCTVSSTVSGVGEIIIM